jgi:hypothetical protein
MKKNYPISALLLLFSLLFLPAHAQKKYSKGYVVTLQGDTLQGFIDDKDWSKNPDKIRFTKELAQSSVTTYRPAQLRSFYIEDTQDYYISYIGKVDHSPFRSNQLLEVTDDSDFLEKDHTVIDSVFLNVFSEGAVSLYFYKDAQQKEHFFFKKGNESPQELVFQKYTRDMMNGQKFVREVRTYRGQLREAMNDCEKVHSAISRAMYTRQALTQIVNTYNACSSQQSTYQRTPERARVTFGVVAGLAQTSFFQTFRDIDLDYTRSYTPMAGVSAQFIIPRNHNSWSAYADLFWKYFQTKAAITPQNTFERTLKVNQAKANFMVRYSVPTQGVRPFINAGGSVSFLIQAKGNILTNSDKDPEEFDKTVLGLVGGGGASFKNYSLELRYEQTKSVFSGLVTQTSERNLYLILRYHFN